MALKKNVIKKTEVITTVDNCNIDKPKCTLELLGTKSTYTYRLDEKKQIGKGSYSTVYIGMIIETNQKVAIKKINLNRLAKLETETINREITIVEYLIKNTTCENIVKYYDVIQIRNTVYIIMELCTEGSLTSLLVKPIKEEYSKYYFKQILNGLLELNKLRIVHKDIKPDNILITNDYRTLKICDFGFSQIMNENIYETNDNVICGSPIYMAPEILFRNISPYTSPLPSPSSNGLQDNILKNRIKQYNTYLTDIWSAGMILFEMFYGHHPCRGQKDITSVRKIVTDMDIDNLINYENTIIISEQGKDFLKALLNKDVINRLTIDMVNEHKWIDSNEMKSTFAKILLSQIFITDKNKSTIDSTYYYQTIMADSDINNIDKNIESLITVQKNKSKNNTNRNNDQRLKRTMDIINNGSFDKLVKENNDKKENDMIFIIE